MKLIVQGAIDRDALFSEVQVDVKEWEILLR